MGAANDADPEPFLGAPHAKRRRSPRNHRVAIAALAAAVGLAVVAVVVFAALPGAKSHPVKNVVSGVGCADISLPDDLATARQDGASMIVATGSLTGRTALDGDVFYQMALRSVQTLSGPPISSGSIGWVDSAEGPGPGGAPSADAGALFASDGRLFAIAFAVSEAYTVGPILRIAPIVGDQVIFSTAGCWDTTGLPTQTYHGRLVQVPGSNSYAQAAQFGFHAVPLATVEKLATG